MGRVYILMRQISYPTDALPPDTLSPFPYPPDSLLSNTLPLRYPTPRCLTPRFPIPWVPIPRVYPNPRLPDNLPPRYPTPWNGHGTRDPLPHPPVNKLTDTCENITFSQLLLCAIISTNLKCDDFNMVWPNK